MSCSCTDQETKEENTRLRLHNEELRTYVWKHASECATNERPGLELSKVTNVEKRPFVRDRGLIVDRYQDARGTPVEHHYPSSMLDEPMTQEVRGERLNEVATGIPGTHASTLVLQ